MILYSDTYKIPSTVSSLISILLRHTPLLLVLMCLSYMFSPMLNSALSIIDDHEIAELSGYEVPLNIHELTIKLLQQDYREPLRYRPLYKIIRAWECFFFHDQSYFWHLNRLALALCVAILLNQLLIRFLTAPSAAIVTLLLFCGKQNEIWLRLGAAEAFACPLILYGLLSLCRQIERGNETIGDYASAGICFLAAAYTKENFVFFLPLLPLFYFGIRYFYTGGDFRIKFPIRCSPRDIFVLTFFVFATGYLVYQLHLAAHNNILMESRQFLSILPNDKTKALLWNASLTLVPLVFFLIQEGWHRFSGASPLQPIGPGIPVAILSSLLLVSLPQWLIYRELIHLHERYLVPGIWGPLLAAALSLFAIEKRGKYPGLRFATLSCLLAFEGNWILATHAWAKQEARINRNYQNEVSQIFTLHKLNPTLPIVFCTNLSTSEQVQATARFLSKQENHPMKFYVKLDETDRNLNIPFERWTSDRFRQEVYEGRNYYLPVTKSILDATCCIGVHVSGNRNLCQYQHTVNISELYIN